MAKKNLTTELKIDKEPEFKEAIKGINSELSLLSSEMRKTTAEFADNANSVEALSAKGEVLQKQLDVQKGKVEALQEQLEKAKEKYGENSKQVQDYQIQLNNAETAVYKTESAIRQNNEALAEAQKEGQGLGEVLGGVANKFGITLPEGVTNSLNSIGNFSPTAVAAIGAVTAAVGATIKAVQELIDITQEAARYVDDINTKSVQSGIDTYTLQVLSYMEELADVSVDSVTSSMTKLTSSMDKARDGAEKQTTAFENLGVSILDSEGNLRNSTDVFWEVIDALGRIENPTERDTVAMDLFGKSAKELNTLIAVGSEGFQTYADEAERVGYILSGEQMTALQNYNDALDRANKAQDAMRQQLGAELAPALQTLTEGWNHLVTEGVELLLDSGIIDFLSLLIKIVGQVCDTLGIFADALGYLLNPIGKITSLIKGENEQLETNTTLTKNATQASKEQTSAIREQGKAAEDAALSMQKLTAEQESFLRSVGITADNIGTINGTYVQAVKDRSGNYQYYSVDTADYSWADKINWDEPYYTNASGDYNFVGGNTLVGENGAEMVSLPYGSKIYNAQDTRNMGGDVFNITIDAKSVREFNDIVDIVKNQRVTTRMGGIT